MSPGLQRVYLFLGLCAVFSVVVWGANIDASPQVLLAQAGNAASSDEDDSTEYAAVCAPGELVRVIIDKNVSVSGGSASVPIRVEKTKPYQKYYCSETVEEGGRVTCFTQRCCNPDGSCDSLCPAVQGPDGNMTRAEGEAFVKFCRDRFCGENPLDPVCRTPMSLSSHVDSMTASIIQNQAAAVLLAQAPQRDCSGSCAAKVIAQAPPPGGSTGGGSSSGGGSTVPNPPINNPTGTGIPGDLGIPTSQQPATLPTQGPSGPSASQGIQAIASSGSQPSAGEQSLFSRIMSPINWENFSFNSGSLGRTSYNAPPSGGLAYGPSAPTNRNFDALNSQTTFSDPLTSPYKVITQIGGEPARRAPLTAEELADSRSSGFVKMLQDMGEALIDPVVSFFDDEASPNSEETEEAEPLHRTIPFGDTGVLELDHPELLLVARDPRDSFADITEIAEGEDAEIPNPLFSGIMVQQDPWNPAPPDLLGALFGVSSGGSGRGGSSGTDEVPASGSMREAFEGAMEDSKPGNAFSAMKLSVKTVFTAIGDLFKNLFSTLFSWL